mgnify:CR=1 FL=1
MENNWSSQLTAIGFKVFSEAHREILAEMSSNGLPANYSVITEAAAESLLQAVAAMITENNSALLTEMSD